jgi:hypothetical protein
MMAGSKGHSNAQSLFGVHQIPSDNHIRDLLDPVKPEQIFPVFEEILQVLKQQGQLRGWRSFTDTRLMVLDGTEYFSSSQIHCPQSSTRRFKFGESHYCHSVVTPVIVCPGRSHVIPLVPESIVSQDGYDRLSLRECGRKTVAVAVWTTL